MAITPKLFDLPPSNFTTILPRTSSSKKVQGSKWLKSIVSELEPKNKIFVRKRAPSWFFAFAGVKRLFFSIFLSETVLDKFRTIFACVRVSPRHHPEKVHVPPMSIDRLIDNYLSITTL